MTEIEQLLQRYEQHVCQPWTQQVAGPERVWLVVYAPEQERRLGRALTRFEMSTTSAGHSWQHLDLTDAFGRWISQHRYRDAYFAEPDVIQSGLTAFSTAVKAQIRAALTPDPSSLLAVTGISALFGLASISDIMQSVADAIVGRLVIFFPGTRDGANYRLLDARDGWNYLAVPITAQDA